MMDHYSLVQRLTGPLPMMDQSRRLNDFAFELGWRPSDRLDIPASNDFATAHLSVEHGLESSSQFPPPPNAFHRELGCVMRHANVDHRPVFSDLVRPVGNRLALRHGREIVSVDAVGLSLGPPRPPPIFEGSHQLFLLRVHRQHRISALPE